MEYYSAIKKNEMLSFVTTWMDLEGSILSEVTQTDEDKYHMIFTFMWILKKENKANEKTKQNTLIENKLMIATGEGVKKAKVNKRHKFLVMK